MKRFIPIILALSLFISSCGALGDVAAPAADATQTMSVEEIRATADSLVYEMLTQTALAMPTDTPIPPTETPLPPTATMEPTAVPTLVEPTVEGNLAAPSPTVAPAVVPTNTLASTSSSAFPCTEKPLTSWDGQSTTIKVTNNVPDTMASVFLCIVTETDAGYISIPAGASAQVPYGYVTATAWVTGKKAFNDTIGFEVKTSDSLQFVIENGRLYLRASCAPRC
jgi:hypothetical protein